MPLQMSFFWLIFQTDLSAMFIFNNSLTGIQRDTDMSETAAAITLSTCQNFAFNILTKYFATWNPFPMQTLISISMTLREIL